jgi:Zn-dependent M28 family amino/carboxypeptidase
VRVILLSTGSEESFLEGMRGFVARHAGALPRERTRFVVLECVGGPEAILLEGEGMLRMRDYTPAIRDWLAGCAERAGHTLRRGLRTGFATDALISLKAGYPTGVLAAIDEYKMAPNYHSQRDVAANLDFGTVAACTAVCLEAIRSLSLSRRAAPAPA